MNLDYATIHLFSVTGYQLGRTGTKVFLKGYKEAVA